VSNLAILESITPVQVATLPDGRTLVYCRCLSNTLVSKARMITSAGSSAEEALDDMLAFLQGKPVYAWSDDYTTYRKYVLDGERFVEVVDHVE
jgi:hypothetical protein